MGLRNKSKQISGSGYFLILIMIIYGLFFIFKSDIFFKSLSFFNETIIKIIPILIIIFVLMAISNYFITHKFIMNHLSDKGIKKWFFVIIGGILSTGPIYMWYPLLSDLKKKGVSYGLIACFLYNRSIKIPILPVAILYFSWKYILVLCFVMIFISIIQGLMINKLMEMNKNDI